MMNSKIKKMVLLSGLLFSTELNTEQVEQVPVPSKLSLIKEGLSLQDTNQDLEEDLDDSFDDDDELDGIDESVLMQLLQDAGFIDSLTTGSLENQLNEDQVKEFLELIKNLSQAQTISENLEESAN